MQLGNINKQSFNSMPVDKAGNSEGIQKHTEKRQQAQAAASNEEIKHQRKEESKQTAKKKKSRSVSSGQTKKPGKRSQTLRIVSYVQIEVPGLGIQTKKVTKKRRIKEMSDRRFDKWAKRHQSASIMQLVNEMSDEADSWNQLSNKIILSDQRDDEADDDKDDMGQMIVLKFRSQISQQPQMKRPSQEIFVAKQLVRNADGQRHSMGFDEEHQVRVSSIKKAIIEQKLAMSDRKKHQIVIHPEPQFDQQVSGSSESCNSEEVKREEAMPVDRQSIPEAQPLDGARDPVNMIRQQVIDRRQREVAIHPRPIEERKDILQEEEHKDQQINVRNDLQQQQEPIIVVQRVEIDELDEDGIDLLLQTAHDPVSLSPNERRRAEQSSRYVNQHFQQSRGLFQKAKTVGKPVYFASND